MAVRVKDIRRGATQLLDMFGDAANVVMLIVVTVAAWRCWGAFAKYYDMTGGVSAIPRSAEGWSRMGTAARMMIQDPYGREALMSLARGWGMAWILLVLAVAFTLLTVAGLRWAWVRLRDLVAGA